MCIGIIRDNSLVSRRARAEARTSATERVRLYCTWRPSALTTQSLEQLWPEVAMFGFFFEKTNRLRSYGKFFKFLFQKFSPHHQSTLLCSNVVNSSDAKSAKSCVIYLTEKNKTKFRLPLKLSLLHGSSPKSARASRQQCAHRAPDFIQVYSLLAV